MEKALLIVSFGTSCPEVLERDIVPVERAIQEALPEYVPLRAFGSGMIARKLRQRDGVVIPTVAEALEALRREGQNHILIGTVEGDPSLDTLCRRLLAEGVGRVSLIPLMLVAGDHAVNDMASEASGSWKSRLQAQGIEARCILRGLGSWEFIQKLYAAHALEAASSREGLDIPGKDDKLR